jgi:hypothetical protein
MKKTRGRKSHDTVSLRCLVITNGTLTKDRLAIHSWQLREHFSSLQWSLKPLSYDEEFRPCIPKQVKQRTSSSILYIWPGNFEKYSWRRKLKVLYSRIFFCKLLLPELSPILYWACGSKPIRNFCCCLINIAVRSFVPGIGQSNLFMIYCTVGWIRNFAKFCPIVRYRMSVKVDNLL